MEFLSIGIPAHNEAESIEITLRHLVQQTAWKNREPSRREIIVCVNGSTDNTEQVVRSFAKRTGLSDQIRVIVSPKGDYFHSMKLISRAVNPSAPYAFFFDADVVPHHKTLDALESELKDPEVHATASQLIPIQRFAHRRSFLVQSQVEFFENCLKNGKFAHLNGGGFGLKRSHFHLFNVPNRLMIGDLYLTERIGRENIRVPKGAKSYFGVPHTAGDYLSHKVRNMTGAAQVYGSENQQAKKFTVRNLLRNVRENVRERRTVSGKIGSVEEIVLRTIAMKLVERHMRRGTLPKWKKVGTSKLAKCA